jgi:hypothetical protein
VGFVRNPSAGGPVWIEEGSEQHVEAIESVKEAMEESAALGEYGLSRNPYGDDEGEQRDFLREYEAGLRGGEYDPDPAPSLAEELLGRLDGAA